MERLYEYRFALFLSTQLAILFGSLLVPLAVFETIISPILLLLNVLSGVLLVSKNRKILIGASILLFVILVIGILEFSKAAFFSMEVNILKMLSYFIFYVLITFYLIKQIWIAVNVNRSVILGLISGYISLGILGFFVCLSIEIGSPGSFDGLSVVTSALTDEMIYYSFITLLTIGYGDIVPVSILAQKASILIGVLGQVYLVIITAIVVGKYLNQHTHK